MITVAFTGSFDPAHIGHRYIVEQAKKLRFNVNVIVANNVDKEYRKDIRDRAFDVSILIPDAPIYMCDGENIGPFMKSIGCDAIIRGIRNTKDFEYEQKIADYNREVNGLETIYIPCPPELRDMSSTKIRATQNIS